MLTLAPMAGGGSSYYLSDNEKASQYYLDGESRTFWGGSAKGALSLPEGEIQQHDFDRLANGFVPNGKRIGNPSAEGPWRHDPGRDLTFSDPKSVSILLQTPLREKLLDIRRAAISRTMDYAEKEFAQTRIKGEYIGGQKTVWAAVHEETSRADDPNSHHHVVLFNIVQGQDSKFRAMFNQPIYDNQILLGQVYRNEVAQGIKKLGFELESVGQHGQWEIKDIPKDIRDMFSKRRKAIVEKIEPSNNTARSREIICLMTRPSKTSASREELLGQWRKELTAHETSFEKLAQPLSKDIAQAPWQLSERVKTTMNIIAETNSHIGRHDFLRAVMSQTYGHFSIDEVTQETRKQIQSGYMVQSECGQFYARSIDQRREKQVKLELQKGHLKSKPLLSESKLKTALAGNDLKSDQLEAIRLLARSNSRFIKFQGHAGTGKTTALRTALPPLKKEGYTLIGLSTTGASTQELADTGVFDRVMTLQKYLLVPEGNERTVLVIDESSQIGRDQMLSLLHFANRKQMPRVLFQGDAKQMGGVQAGEPFKDMEKAGVRSVILDQIIRQKDVRHRRGLIELTQEKLRDAFKTLKPEIHEISSENMIEHTIKAWEKTGDVKTPIIIQTNKQKAEINQAIKDKQVGNKLGKAHLALNTWQPVYKSDEEKRFVSSYENATHIRFNRDYKSLKIQRGDIYKVEGIDSREAQLVLTKDGRTRKFKPANYKMGRGAVELYKQEKRVLHEGDRIRFTRGGHRQPVFNNDYGTVKTIEGEKVTFELDRGKTLSLTLEDTAIRHIDHAWANTTHAFQGKTVEHAVVVMPSRRSPLTSLESLYTSASRHRLSLTIITDNADRLKGNIEHTLNTRNLQSTIKWPENEAARLQQLEKQKIRDLSGMANPQQQYSTLAIQNSRKEKREKDDQPSLGKEKKQRSIEMGR